MTEYTIYIYNKTYKRIDRIIVEAGDILSAIALVLVDKNVVLKNITKIESKEIKD